MKEYKYKGTHLEFEINGEKYHLITEELFCSEMLKNYYEGESDGDKKHKSELSEKDNRISEIEKVCDSLIKSDKSQKEIKDRFAKDIIIKDKQLSKYKEALEFADKFIAVVMRRTHHGNDWIRDYETGTMVVELIEGLTKFKDLYSQAINQDKEDLKWKI